MSVIFWRDIYNPNVEWSRGVTRLVSRRAAVQWESPCSMTSWWRHVFATPWLAEASNRL